MIDNIKEKLKEAYDDAVDYFNGEDRAEELLEKAVWANYHAQAGELAKAFAGGDEAGGSGPDDGELTAALLALRIKRDAKLDRIGSIIEAVDKAEEAVAEKREAEEKAAEDAKQD